MMPIERPNGNAVVWFSLEERLVRMCVRYWMGYSLSVMCNLIWHMNQKECEKWETERSADVPRSIPVEFRHISAPRRSRIWVPLCSRHVEILQIMRPERLPMILKYRNGRPLGPESTVANPTVAGELSR
ncbi:hypothetical protein J6590_012441 [Homalodisca vitripennis]|nr:hypothetical protein J6590_012441 [Homalodisca vitripennis]